MKLFDVGRGKFVRLRSDTYVPPGGNVLKKDTILYFDHVDGMYSYCKTLNHELVHPVAWADVAVLRNVSDIEAQYERNKTV